MLIYLAAPYSDPDFGVRAWRYNRVKEALWALYQAQIPAISPIIIGHEYTERSKGTVPLPHDFWMRIARALLQGCSELYVLTLPGWESSAGVLEEVRLAWQLGKPVLGFPFFDQCEPVSGAYILGAFGCKPHPARPLIPSKRRVADDQEEPL